MFIVSQENPQSNCIFVNNIFDDKKGKSKDEILAETTKQGLEQNNDRETEKYICMWHHFVISGTARQRRTKYVSQTASARPWNRLWALATP